jgi:hypothetical protein
MSEKAKTPTETAIEAAFTRIVGRVQLRWTQEQATLVAIDELVREYEPRVAALEGQLAELLTKLGEGPAKGKSGK